MPESPKRERFPPDAAPKDAIAITAQCRLRTQDGHRVVLVAGMTTAHYAVGDALADAHAMVSLIEQGGADQVDVARAFGRDGAAGESRRGSVTRGAGLQSRLIASSMCRSWQRGFQLTSIALFY